MRQARHDTTRLQVVPVTHPADTTTGGSVATVDSLEKSRRHARRAFQLYQRVQLRWGGRTGIHIYQFYHAGRHLRRGFRKRADPLERSRGHVRRAFQFFISARLHKSTASLGRSHGHTHISILSVREAGCDCKRKSLDICITLCPSGGEVCAIPGSPHDPDGGLYRSIPWGGQT